MEYVGVCKASATLLLTNTLTYSETPTDTADLVMVFPLNFQYRCCDWSYVHQSPEKGHWLPDLRSFNPSSEVSGKAPREV